MQGPAWLSLLRRLPPALHDGLIIVTTNTAEVVVSSVLRAERDLLVIRGRMSGSQETGRVVFIPFDQINYIALGKKITEAEIQTVLAKPVAGGHAAEAAVATPAATGGAEEVDAFIPESSPEALPAPEPEKDGAPAAAAAGGPQKPNHPSKTVLLARLRARLAGEAAGKPDA